jgi:hypothetical protein
MKDAKLAGKRRAATILIVVLLLAALVAMPAYQSIRTLWLVRHNQSCQLEWLQCQQVAELGRRLASSQAGRSGRPFTRGQSLLVQCNSQQWAKIIFADCSQQASSPDAIQNQTGFDVVYPVDQTGQAAANQLPLRLRWQGVPRE